MTPIKTFGIAAATAMLAASFTITAPATAEARSKGMRAGSHAGAHMGGGYRKFAVPRFRGSYRGGYRGGARYAYRGNYAYPRRYYRSGRNLAALPFALASGLLFGLSSPAYSYGYPAYSYDYGYGYPYGAYPATYGYYPQAYQAPGCVIRPVRVYRHGWKWIKQRYCY